MEEIDTRSDSRRRWLSASPSEVFAAMGDPARIADQVFEIEHLGEHHFLLTLELAPMDGGTGFAACRATR